MTVSLYVDGSYKNEIVGWGTVVVEEGLVKEELNGAISNETAEGTRQVAGELKAVMEGLIWAQKNSLKVVNIYYDYIGIEAWVTGKWKAKKNITIQYRDFIQKIQSDIKINWYKVKAHSGDKFNDIADLLAKKGVGA